MIYTQGNHHHEFIDEHDGGTCEQNPMDPKKAILDDDVVTPTSVPHANAQNTHTDDDRSQGDNWRQDTSSATPSISNLPSPISTDKLRTTGLRNWFLELQHASVVHDRISQSDIAHNIGEQQQQQSHTRFTLMAPDCVVLLFV